MKQAPWGKASAIRHLPKGRSERKNTRHMKKTLIAIVCAGAWSGLWAQDTLQLERCYEAALAQAPVLANESHLRTLGAHQLARLDAMRMPAIAFRATGTLQSENIQLDFPPQAPLQPIELPLYRLQAWGEVSYVLYDGGRTEAAKALTEARITRQQAEIHAHTDAIRQQVQDTWFQALLLQQQEALVRSGLKVLDERIEAVRAAVDNGVVLASALRELQAQRTQTEGELQRLRHLRAGVLASLAVLTGLPIDTSAVLAWPAEPDLPEGDFSARADMKVWPLRQAELTAQARQLDHARTPTVGAFVQAGVGLPNPLNFFDDNLSPYGLIGLQATWQPFDWGATQHQRDALSVQALMLEQQRRQTELALEAQQAALLQQLEGWEKTLSTDREVLALRRRIADEVARQLEQGVRTATDYLTAWQAVQSAALSLELHRLQRLQVLYRLQALHGHF